MNKVEQQLMYIKEKESYPEINEERLLRTIERSKRVVINQENQNRMTYIEFIFSQIKYINKWWWLVQSVILAVTWYTLYQLRESSVVYRKAGVLIPLFVIAVIPELWKNIRYQAMEVEHASFYTLRQLYASRFITFGIVDLILLTIFFSLSAATLELPVMFFIIHFMVPLNITCCICFTMFCWRRGSSETIALLLCMVWNVIWYQMVGNDALFNQISTPIWIGIVVTSGVYGMISIWRILSANKANQEVITSWNLN